MFSCAGLGALAAGLCAIHGDYPKVQPHSAVIQMVLVKLVLGSEKEQYIEFRYQARWLNLLVRFLV
jgi:hypothetical protein